MTVFIKSIPPSYPQLKSNKILQRQLYNRLFHSMKLLLRETLTFYSYSAAITKTTFQLSFFDLSHMRHQFRIFSNLFPSNWYNPKIDRLRNDTQTQYATFSTPKFPMPKIGRIKKPNPLKNPISHRQMDPHRDFNIGPAPHIIFKVCKSGIFRWCESIGIRGSPDKYGQ